MRMGPVRILVTNFDDKLFIDIQRDKPNGIASVDVENLPRH